MAIAETIARLLEAKRIRYEEVVHSHSDFSMETAEAAHVSGERVAKGVVLKDGEGYLLAVLPATHTLDVDVLGALLGRRLALAHEDELAALFPDCELGAVPAVGPAYGLETVVDERLLAQDRLYLEAGDHEELIRVTREEFEALVDGASFGTFSVHQS